MANTTLVALFPPGRLGRVINREGFRVRTDLGDIDIDALRAGSHKLARIPTHEFERHRRENPEIYGHARPVGRQDGVPTGPMQLYQLGIISLATCQSMMGLPPMGESAVPSNDLDIAEQLRAVGVDDADIAALLATPPPSPYRVEDPLARTVPGTEKARRRIDRQPREVT